jgi:hypothetical protein
MDRHVGDPCQVFLTSGKSHTTEELVKVNTLAEKTGKGG